MYYRSTDHQKSSNRQRALRRTVIGAVNAASVAALSTALAQDIDFTNYQPEVTAVQIDDQLAPNIDGVVDEAAWASAGVIDQFYLTLPNEGGAPREPTRARVMYDSKYLYVAMEAQDDAPEEMRALLLARDDSVFRDQAVRVMVDPYESKREAYYFATNPNGIKTDALIEGGAGYRGEWNAIWDVEATITEDGWTAEFAIPVSFSEL